MGDRPSSNSIAAMYAAMAALEAAIDPAASQTALQEALMPIRDGDLLGRGVGPRAADAMAQEAVQARMRDPQIGRVCVLQALAVRDPAVWQFCAAYQRIEAAAFAESRCGGLNCTGSGGGDGIPLGHEQRLSVEIPLLLDRLREILEEATTDPRRALEALDKLGGAW